MSNIQVANLFIYNPTLGNEFTEGEKVLAFYPDIEFNEQKFYVGLCEGLIAFAGGFTQLIKMDYIQTEKYHVGILSPELNFYIILMLVRGEDDDIDDETPRIVLQHILRHFYSTFTLLNSNFSSIQARESLCGLRDRFTLFLSHYIPLIPSVINSTVSDRKIKPLIEMSGSGIESNLLQVAGGLHYATMDKIIFLTIRYFISSLNINFPHTDTIALFHQNQLVFTQLSAEETVVLQFVLSHESMVNYLGLNARLCTRRMSDEGYKKKLTQAEAELIPSKCIPVEAITNPGLYIYDTGSDDDYDDQDDDNNTGEGDDKSERGTNGGNMTKRSKQEKKAKKQKQQPFQLPSTDTNRHQTHSHNCGLAPFITAHCCKFHSQGTRNQNSQNGQNGLNSKQQAQKDQNTTPSTTTQNELSSNSLPPSILSDPLNAPGHTIVSPPVYFNLMTSPSGSIFDPKFDLEIAQLNYHKTILKDILLFLQSGESSFDWYQRKAKEEMEREKRAKVEMLERQRGAQWGLGNMAQNGQNGQNAGKSDNFCQISPLPSTDRRYQSYLIVLQFDETRVVLSVTSAAPIHNGDDGCDVCAPEETEAGEDGGNSEKSDKNGENSDKKSCTRDQVCKCIRGTHPDGIGFCLEMPLPPPEEDYSNDYDSYDDENDETGDKNDQNDQNNQQNQPDDPEEAPPRAPPMPPFSYNPYTGTTSLFKHYYSQLAQFVQVNIGKIIHLIFPTNHHNSPESQSYDPSLPPHIYHNKANGATKSTFNPALFPAFSSLSTQIHAFKLEFTKNRSLNYIQSRSLDSTATITATSDPTMSLVCPGAARASVLLPLGQRYFSPPQYHPNLTPVTQNNPKGTLGVSSLIHSVSSSQVEVNNQQGQGGFAPGMKLSQPSDLPSPLPSSSITALESAMMTDSELFLMDQQRDYMEHRASRRTASSTASNSSLPFPRSPSAASSLASIIDKAPHHLLRDGSQRSLFEGSNGSGNGNGNGKNENGLKEGGVNFNLNQNAQNNGQNRTQILRILDKSPKLEPIYKVSNQSCSLNLIQRLCPDDGNDGDGFDEDFAQQNMQTNPISQNAQNAKNPQNYSQTPNTRSSDPIAHLRPDHQQLNLDSVLNPDYISAIGSPPLQPQLYFDHFNQSHSPFSNSPSVSFLPFKMSPTTVIPHYSSLTSLHALPLCPENYFNNKFVYDLSQMTPGMVDGITNPDVVRGLLLSLLYGKRVSVLKALKQYQLQRAQMLSSPTVTQNQGFFKGPESSTKQIPSSSSSSSSTPSSSSETDNTPVIINPSDPEPTTNNATPFSSLEDVSGELIDTNELDASQFYTPDELKLDWSWLLPQNHQISLLSVVASSSLSLAMSNAQHTQRELYIASARIDNGQNGLTTAPMVTTNGTLVAVNPPPQVVAGNSSTGAAANNSSSSNLTGGSQQQQHHQQQQQHLNLLSNVITLPSNYIVQDMYNVVNVVDLVNELSKMQKGLFKHLFSF